MSNAADKGFKCALKIGAYVLPAVLNSCSTDIQLNLRAVLAAQGQPSALIGYAPGANAKSGFTATVKIPYRQGSGEDVVTADAILNAILSTAGVDVTMQFGLSGGVDVPGCIAFGCVIQGSEGNDITAALTMESTQFGTVGSTVTAPEAFDNVFAFSDAASIVLNSGTEYDIFNSFAFRITRTRVPYVGNSTTGIAQKLGVGYTEVMVDQERLIGTEGDAEVAVFKNVSGGGPTAQTRGDVVITLTQVLLPDGQDDPDTLVLTATDCFYDAEPKRTGSETEWNKQSSTSKAAHGAFTIAAA